MPATAPTPAPAKHTVMVVEDQTAIRQMLVAFVSAMPGFEVVGEAGAVEEALRVAQEKKPEIVVLDWMLLDGLGSEFMRLVRNEPPPLVLVFSANTTDLAVREALACGARGYIEKTASFGEFTAALEAIGAGRTYLGPAVARSVQRIARSPDTIETNFELSAREREVLRLLAEGLSSKEIAVRLSLSVRTVENHRARITRRTGLRSIAQLTLHAVRLGLVEAPAVMAETEEVAS
ncbi:MAG TPA: response regulator transcription factor [Opitutaceae bacterium]|nr:response regulator transcription factor [Opitutaceae bacterium]HND61201.1 response regulator transcription factor [Opitutaceae bacterium]